MAKPTNKSNGQPDKLTTAEAASLDKVRDILFGKQVRQSEKRFDGIESRLSREIDQLRKDQEKQLASLRADVEKQLASLGEGLENEKSERTEHVRTVEAEMTGRMAELEAAATAMEEKISAELVEHRHAVQRELASIEQRQAEVLGEAMSQLRSEFTGRNQMAALLRGLADSMADEK